jgi:hypothetical protein
MRNDDRFLFGRDNRDLWEYRMGYTITMADDDMFSIHFYGHLYTIWRGMMFSYDITINARTGEIFS